MRVTLPKPFGEQASGDWRVYDEVFLYKGETPVAPASLRNKRRGRGRTQILARGYREYWMLPSPHKTIDISAMDDYNHISPIYC